MNHATGLRAQLRTRAEARASTPGIVSYKSLGTPPTVLFKPTGGARSHGNFHDESWAAIQQTPEWATRLGKRHSQPTALPIAERLTAMELDSSNSSDALLMNCFCCPGAPEAIVRGLGLDPGPSPGPMIFGFLAKLKLTDGGLDATEVDLRFGALLFEAKLTEADFTSRPKPHVFRYATLLDAFNVDVLPSDGASFRGYQVIRNILAAQEHGASSVVIVDARRPDLREEWEAVSTAIKVPALAARCHLRTWQDVAAAAPAGLKVFLEAKYGV